VLIGNIACEKKIGSLVKIGWEELIGILIPSLGNFENNFGTLLGTINW
jgi:hypothetical protein